FPYLSQPPPPYTLFPYTTLFRSHHLRGGPAAVRRVAVGLCAAVSGTHGKAGSGRDRWNRTGHCDPAKEYHSQPALDGGDIDRVRSEEHTSELQSRFDLVCRLLLE